MAKWESYEIWLTTDQGHRLSLLNRHVLSGQYSMVIGDRGKFFFELDHAFDRRMLQKDRLIQIWRAPPARRLSLQRLYFLRGWEFVLGSDNSPRTIVRGPDSLDILRRRHIAYTAGLAFSAKNDFADSMMVEIVQENVVSATDTTRNLTTVSVGPQLDLGPIVKHVFHWKRVLDTIKAIHKSSIGAGTEVFFDVVPAVTRSSVTFTFRTYVGQPGKNRTHSGTLFADDLGNLRDGKLSYDFDGEATACYSLGDGSGAARDYSVVLDQSLHGVDASVYARIETTADARDSNQDAMDSIGYAELGVRRRRIRMAGKPVDTESSVYGVDWRFGDRVETRFQGETFDAIVRSVVVTMQGEGREDIDAVLQHEG